MGMGIRTRDTASPKTIGYLIRELVRVAFFSFLAILIVRYFLFKPFYVKGASMEPTFLEHEYLIVDEITYRFRDPARGEVVVFRPPIARRDFYLKRVAGLPGETIKITNGFITIFNDEYPSGFVFEEPYLRAGARPADTLTAALKEDEYFLLGDNRMVSADSRRFGSVKRSAIVGRVWLRGWPIGRLSVFLKPPMPVIDER